MASLTQWTWVWATSGRWWWIGKPGVLQSMGLQSDVTEWLNRTDIFGGTVKATPGTSDEVTDNEMVGWHHQLNGHEFEQAPGDGDGQGSLACCSLWGRRVRLDWATELNWEAGGGGWFGGVIQAHYISCAFYFYHYDISSTSDHQGLHPRGWGPLPNSISFGLSCKRYPARLRHYWRERESRYSVGTGNVDFAEGRCFPRIFFRLPWE